MSTTTYDRSRRCRLSPAVAVSRLGPARSPERPPDRVASSQQEGAGIAKVSGVASSNVSDQELLALAPSPPGPAFAPPVLPVRGLAPPPTVQSCALAPDPLPPALALSLLVLSPAPRASPFLLLSRLYAEFHFQRSVPLATAVYQAVVLQWTALALALALHLAPTAVAVVQSAPGKRDGVRQMLRSH